MSQQNGHLTKAQLMAKRHRRYIEIALPDKSVARLRSLSGREMQRLRKEANKHQDYVDDLLIVYTWVDPEKNEPLLTVADATSGDLSEIDSRYRSVLANAAAEHVGWIVDYDAKEINDALKNSSETG